MKIGIDISSVMAPHITGIGRYTLEISKALCALQEAEIRGFYKISRLKYMHYLHKRLSISARPYVPLLTNYFPLRSQLFHGTDFRLPFSGSYKKVVTIHDLVVFERQLNDPEWSDYGMAKFERMLAKSKPDHIIAVSDFTKYSFLRYFPEYQNQVSTVHHGMNHIGEVEPRSMGYEWPFLLFVGTLEKRKNVIQLIRSFNRIAADHPDLRLVLAGKPGFQYEEIQKARANSPYHKRIIELGYVDEAQLAGLYADAEMLVYPSLYEGFGFPILEAMHQNCPVVTSNAGALKEVGKGASLTVNPHSDKLIAEAIDHLLHSPSEKDRLRALGQERIKHFTWQKAAQNTLQVYKKTL